MGVSKKTQKMRAWHIDCKYGWRAAEEANAFLGSRIRDIATMRYFGKIR